MISFYIHKHATLVVALASWFTVHKKNMWREMERKTIVRGQVTGQNSEQCEILAFLSVSILLIFLLYFKKAISFILILHCVSSQSPVLCVVWTMTPLIKMLFSQVSLCIHIHIVWYWTNFKLRSVHPHLLYAFTRITQCMFTSRWPRQCFLYNAFQSVYII